MSRDELRRAIERPAQRVGLSVEPELADALLADVEGEPGALPLLSTALLELWRRRDGPPPAARGVRAQRRRPGRRRAAGRGRVRRARRRPSRPIARNVLLRLAGEGEGGAIVRRRVALGELDGRAPRTSSRRLTRPPPADGRATARSRSRTRRCCASGRGCAAGSRRTSQGRRAAPPAQRRRARLGGRRARPGRASTAARGWPRRSSGAPAHEDELNAGERAFLDAGRAAARARAAAGCGWCSAASSLLLGRGGRSPALVALDQRGNARARRARRRGAAARRAGAHRAGARPLAAARAPGRRARRHRRRRAARCSPRCCAAPPRSRVMRGDGGACWRSPCDRTGARSWPATTRAGS